MLSLVSSWRAVRILPRVHARWHSSSSSSCGASSSFQRLLASELPSDATSVAAPPSRNIIGMPKEELTQEMVRLGLEPYRAKQVWQWLYKKGVTSFDHMRTLSHATRQTLSSNFVISHGGVKHDSISSDGTRKFLVNFSPDEVECVFIPEAKRGTLCVSSQVGCSMKCTFCHTGTQGLVRNLSASEIVGQVITARKLLMEFGQAAQAKRIVSNVVFMGQGEPLYNYRQVAKALSVILDGEGLALARHRVTVSTSGVAPLITRLGTDFEGIGLAISLHAVTDELRDVLVPANKQWPIREVLAACRAFPGLKANNRITIEYVLLDGINDSPREARALASMLNFPSLVNLIPFNPWPGTSYKCSQPEAIQAFADELDSRGIKCTVRHPRGRDILAACGQLRTESMKQAQQSTDSMNQAQQYLGLTPT